MLCFLNDFLPFLNVIKMKPPQSIFIKFPMEPVKSALFINKSVVKHKSLREYAPRISYGKRRNSGVSGLVLQESFLRNVVTLILQMEISAEQKIYLPSEYLIDLHQLPQKHAEYYREDYVAPKPAWLPYPQVHRSQLFIVYGYFFYR